MHMKIIYGVFAILFVVIGTGIYVVFSAPGFFDEEYQAELAAGNAAFCSPSQMVGTELGTWAFDNLQDALIVLGQPGDAAVDYEVTSSSHGPTVGLFSEAVCEPVAAQRPDIGREQGVAQVRLGRFENGAAAINNLDGGVTAPSGTSESAQGDDWLVFTTPDVPSFIHTRVAAGCVLGSIDVYGYTSEAAVALTRDLAEAAAAASCPAQGQAGTD